MRERRSFSNDFKKQIVESIVSGLSTPGRAGKRAQDITGSNKPVEEGIQERKVLLKCKFSGYGKAGTQGKGS